MQPFSIKYYAYISLLLLLSCQAHDSKRSDVVASVKRDSTPAQNDPTNPYDPLDLSPLDMTYFPVDFPKIKMTKDGDELPLARVIYSRPHRQGRKIFGALLKYGEPWRLGANEATEIEFFRNVTIQNRKINKGRYLLYCIPEPGNWTIVFNSNLYSWGLKIDSKRDLFKFQIPAQHSAIPIEYFTMVFEPSATGASLVMTWDDVVARLPITFK